MTLWKKNGRIITVFVRWTRLTNWRQAEVVRKGSQPGSLWSSHRMETQSSLMKMELRRWPAQSFSNQHITLWQQLPVVVTMLPWQQWSLFYKMLVCVKYVKYLSARMGKQITVFHINWYMHLIVVLDSLVLLIYGHTEILKYWNSNWNQPLSTLHFSSILLLNVIIDLFSVPSPPLQKTKQKQKKTIWGVFTLKVPDK